MSGGTHRSFKILHRVAGSLALLLFIVMVFGGLVAGVSAGTIVVRAGATMVGVLVLGRVIIKVISTFEEV